MAKSAPKPKSRIHVNLLYPQGASSKLPVQFIRWLIVYGRFIVVVVEILVLITFGLRFKYDAELADLKDKINAQIPYLQSLSRDETAIKQVQQKLSIINKNYANAPAWQDNITKINNLVPLGIRLTNISLDHSAPPTIVFRLNGLAGSNNDLGYLLYGLKSDQAFKDVLLANITYDQEGINFTITGTIR